MHPIINDAERDWHVAFALNDADLLDAPLFPRKSGRACCCGRDRLMTANHAGQAGPHLVADIWTPNAASGSGATVAPR